MKLYSKLMAGIIGLASLSRALLAADAISASTPYSTNTHVPSSYSVSNSRASSWSNVGLLALSGQAALLKEMVQEHQSRAADLLQKGQSEKAKWETELVNELQEKSAQLQKGMDQGTQAWLGTNNKAGAGEVDDRLAFVSAVETRLEQLRQEVSAALDETRALSVQIGAKKAAEDIATMSVALSENQRLVKELQREQFDLELRKLEFRAIWKTMQK